ncbi:hypothetical protein HUV48_08500 [Altererythrobacter sp. HHU K3-1]|uniref:Anti-sigma factor NepR domain-containing protein n=2 Tax=Qipengyuania atrilutea TaxID=2744473 RepID=A0A850H5A1_9SPHN|nr:NepR family anti-sigma factor [Actirhodobacter atriluteus]NVD45058.1 hypothetical protein [Actirhodobacter atriluteus]
MAGNKDKGGTGSAEISATKKKDVTDAEWANGLRQLYDSVVDEELPDSFKDLLSKLDNKGD